MRTHTAPAKQRLHYQRVASILLVEDCKSDVYLFEQLLEKCDIGCFYEITDVPRLADAFRKLEQEPFDLVMLDLNLLDIDGVTSVAALHAQVPHLPIVVYSGTDDARTKEKALLCGASYYFVKGLETGSGLKQIIEHVVA